MIRIHQIITRAQYADAITNDALSIHAALKRGGYDSRLYATERDSACLKLFASDEDYKAFMGKKEDVLIFHYSVYNSNYKIFLKSRNIKILKYHNITPPEFMIDNPEVAYLCEKGRDLLGELKNCRLALGDSEYNRLELTQAGFSPEKTGVLHVFTDPARLKGDVDERERIRLANTGRPRFLFVGRFVRNKKIEDIIKLFAVYRNAICAEASLLITGWVFSHQYLNEILDFCVDLGVSKSVDITLSSNPIPDALVSARYSSADAYISMSEHEGFCVPLLEAMCFDIPVFAYSAAAVPYTLQNSGVLFMKKDYVIMAEAIRAVVENSELRNAVIEKQRAVLEDYSTQSISEKLLGYIEIALSVN